MDSGELLFLRLIYTLLTLILVGYSLKVQCSIVCCLELMLGLGLKLISLEV